MGKGKKKGAKATASNGAASPPTKAGDVTPTVAAKAAHDMAKLHVQREALKKERRDAMADFKERLSSLDQQMGELVDLVNTGKKPEAKGGAQLGLPGKAGKVAAKKVAHKSLVEDGATT